MLAIPADLTPWLQRQASKLGLRLLGVVPLAEEADFARFKHWLERGDQAGMDYLERNQELRRDPRLLLPGAQSAVILGLDYYLGDKLSASDGPRIAQYARFRDYHRTLRRRCDELLRELLMYCGAEQTHVGRSLVDSVPILERALAARTSEGFIGKNTCYIHPRHGSFVLLAEILTSLPLPTDRKEYVAPDSRSERGGCGSCKRCQVHCPTGALGRDYSLDATRCLSYWTIEHRGTIPQEFWPHLAKYYFGCDICQLACPYNRTAKKADEQLLKLRDVPPLFAVATMNQAFYEQVFGGTPMTRAKREGLMRNALIAMTVTRDPQLDEALRLVEEREDAAVLRDTVAQIAAYRRTR